LGCLHGCFGEKLLVADPGVGLLEYFIPDFLHHWNDGVILLLDPDPARLGKTSNSSEGLKIFRHYLVPFRPLLTQAISLNVLIGLLEVGAFYWTVLAPDIVNPGREERVSIQL